VAIAFAQQNKSEAFKLSSFEALWQNDFAKQRKKILVVIII
jgi:hypothetical protein